MADQDTQPTDRAASAAVVAAVLSVLYSWFLFYLKGDWKRGIFTGLWAPTILALSNQLESSDMIADLSDEVED